MRKGMGLLSGALAVIILSPAAAGPIKGNADYPPEALAKHQQGSVLADLAVGPDGRVKGCAVLVSSNSPVLDAQTCSMLTSDLRFSPKRDSRGAAVESHELGRVNWVIPGCATPKQSDPRLHQRVEATATITSLQHC